MNEEWGRWQFIVHRSSFIVAAALLIAMSAIGQTNQYTPITPIPLGDTYLSLPSSHIAGNGSWEVKFTHRFNQSLDQGSLSDRLHSLWGLDSNADVGIGLPGLERPGEGVQVVGAVGEGRPLREAGRPGRVEDDVGVALVERHGRLVVRAAFGQRLE